MSWETVLKLLVLAIGLRVVWGWAIDDPRGFGAYRARCGVHLDALIVQAPRSTNTPTTFVATCANCNAVLPLARFKASRP